MTGAGAPSTLLAIQQHSLPPPANFPMVATITRHHGPSSVAIRRLAASSGGADICSRLAWSARRCGRILRFLLLAFITLGPASRELLATQPPIADDQRVPSRPAGGEDDESRAVEERAKRLHFKVIPRPAAIAERPGDVRSPDGRVLAKVVGKNYRWNAQLFHAQDTHPAGPVLPLAAHRVTALAVAADNRTVATAIGNLSQDWGEVRVWDGVTGRQLARYTVAETAGQPALGEVLRIAFNRDGTTLTIEAGPAGGR